MTWAEPRSSRSTLFGPAIDSAHVCVSKCTNPPPLRSEPWSDRGGAGARPKRAKGALKLGQHRARMIELLTACGSLVTPSLLLHPEAAVRATDPARQSANERRAASDGRVGIQCKRMRWMFASAAGPGTIWVGRWTTRIDRMWAVSIDARPPSNRARPQDSEHDASIHNLRLAAAATLAHHLMASPGDLDAQDFLTYPRQGSRTRPPCTRQCLRSAFLGVWKPRVGIGRGGWAWISSHQTPSQQWCGQDTPCLPPPLTPTPTA